MGPPHPHETGHFYFAQTGHSHFAPTPKKNGKFYLASGGRFDRSSMEASAAIKPAQAQPILAAISAPASCGSLGPLGLQASYNFHLVNTPGVATKFSTVQGGIRFAFQVVNFEIRGVLAARLAELTGTSLQPM
jgi:hypothetical protein